MPEMVVRVRRPHFGAGHAVRGVPQFVDILRFNGLGEAGPPAPGVKFVRRGEQRLAGHKIDVDARFLVIQIFAGSGGLRAALLGYVPMGSLFCPAWRMQTPAKIRQRCASTIGSKS